MALTSNPTVPFLIYAAWNWIIIIPGYLVIRSKGITWKHLGFSSFRFSDIAFGIIGALIGLFIIYPLSVWIAETTGIPPMKGVSYSLNEPFSIISILLSAVLLGSLAEDIIFRGYLLNLLKSKIHNLWIVGFAGVILFTLVHIPYFGCGGSFFILLWSPLTVGLFLWRRNIFPSYIMHLINNFFAYMIVPLFLK